jgi:hypothetical protein
MMEIIIPALHKTYFYSLNKYEKKILEVILFCRIYKTIIEIFKNLYKDYFVLIKNQFNREDETMDIRFLQLIIKDILISGEYTLEGIANVLHIPLDVIVEIASGINENPSLNIALKILNLHQAVRKDFYVNIIDMILEEAKSLKTT